MLNVAIKAIVGIIIYFAVHSVDDTLVLPYKTEMVSKNDLKMLS